MSCDRAEPRKESTCYYFLLLQLLLLLLQQLSSCPRAAVGAVASSREVLAVAVLNSSESAEKLSV